MSRTTLINSSLPSTKRIMGAGRCTAKLLAGQYSLGCPCEGGVFGVFTRDGQGAIQEDQPCQRCGHSLAFHEDVQASTQASRPSTPPPPSRILEKADRVANDPSYCRRSETVNKLIALLDRQLLVHVRGTPASGKSTLAALLYSKLQSQGRRVFLMGKWKLLEKFGHSDALINLHTMLKQTFPSDRGSHDDYLNDNSVLIIDEAQNTYQDEDLWNDVLKERSSSHSRVGIRFILFCSYGSQTTGVENVAYSPNSLVSSQRVTLTPQKDPGSPNVGLFYTRTEFDEVVSLASRWNFNGMTAYNDEAKDYLYNLTNGHPGCLDAVMEFIFKEYRSKFKHDDQFVLNEQSLIDVIESDDAATIEGLESSTVSRCFPATASPACANLLCEVTIHERLEWNSKNMAMVECYQRGWVHRMRIPEQDRHLTLDMCVLPSRLHERYIEYMIGDRTRSIPARFSDLNTLCIEILKTFSKSRLKNSIVGRTLSTAAQPRPLEAQYQDEFYKGFCGLVGKGVPISSEWSRSSAGRVDFWIPGKKWAIELLRDHDNIGGHIGRFKEHGTYHPWLKKREVLDWIVIDCATTLPPPTLYKENIIYAIFTVDYKSLRILDRNKNQLGETISLQN